MYAIFGDIAQWFRFWKRRLYMEPTAKRQRLAATSNQAEATAQASSSRQQHHREFSRFEGTGVQNHNGNLSAGRDIIVNPYQPPIEPENRDLLLESLKFDQIETRRLTIKKAYARTCQWLLQNSLYKRWRSKDSLKDGDHFLWIKGKPGAGKSTLMKFLFEQQKETKQNDIVISFFFNARGQALEKSTIGLYRSLSLQLLQQQPELAHVLDDFRHTWDWNIESLKTLFEKAIQIGQTPVTCLIDALDECEEEDARAMVEFLRELVYTGNRLYICFASRHYPNISLETGLCIILEEQIEQRRDIDMYLEGSLRIGTGQLADQIRSDLRKKASGIFMWVVIVVGILNKEYDAGRKHAMLEKLQKLPAGLHELFRDILTRDNNHQEALILCVQWVALAKQPLTPKQLYFAIVSGYEPHHLVSCHSDEISNEDMHKYILNNSKGLVKTTESKKSTVQFIHESVRDFLLKAGGLVEVLPSTGADVYAQGHEALKNCCVTYITMALPPGIQESSRGALFQKLPFLEHAVHYVLQYAEEAQVSGVNQSSFLANFPLEEWIQRHNLVNGPLYKPQASLLYILAWLDMPALIRAYGSRQSCFDVEHGRYGLPILAAAAMEHFSAVQAMLEAQSYRAPQFPWPYFQTLIPARLNSFFSVCPRFLKFHKRRPKIPQLLLYCNEGLSLYLLLAGVCDYKSKDAKGKTLLESTVDRGYIILLRELVQRDPAAIPTKEIATGLLFRAMCLRKVEVPEFLIALGGDVTCTNEDGRTPLHTAAHATVAKLLIERGADVSIADRDGMTPLHCALQRRHPDVAELLIQCGSIFSGADNGGNTPLHYACSDSANLEAAKLLVQRGADILVVDDRGRTPMHLACCCSGMTELVKLLIERGCDDRAVDQAGATPLHFAAKTNGSLETVRLLTERGVDVSAADKKGRAPLHYALEGGLILPENVVQLLIKHGADVSMSDIDGNTPMHLTNSLPVAEMLIKCGANVFAEDNKGRTPMSYAFQRCDRSMIELFMGNNLEDKTESNVDLSWLD